MPHSGCPGIIGSQDGGAAMVVGAETAEVFDWEEWREAEPDAAGSIASAPPHAAIAKRSRSDSGHDYFEKGEAAPKGRPAKASIRRVRSTGLPRFRLAMTVRLEGRRELKIWRPLLRSRRLHKTDFPSKPLIQRCFAAASKEGSACARHLRMRGFGGKAIVKKGRCRRRDRPRPSRPGSRRARR